MDLKAYMLRTNLLADWEITLARLSLQIMDKLYLMGHAS